jgi:hypothetical protein
VSSKAPNATLLADKYPIHSAPVILTGEDRNFGGNQLFVDLVPKGCSFTNCRFNVDACDFDRLFNHVIGRASFTCECCGFESKDNLAHFKIAERWSFDDETKTQKLMRLLCVCENCHKSIHMSKKDKIEASAHLQQICGTKTVYMDIHSDFVTNFTQFDDIEIDKQMGSDQIFRCAHSKDKFSIFLHAPGVGFSLKHTSKYNTLLGQLISDFEPIPHTPFFRLYRGFFLEFGSLYIPLIVLYFLLLAGSYVCNKKVFQIFFKFLF